MTDRADLQSVDYRPKERTWATPASVFPGDLLFPIHCELGLCGLGGLARNPLLADLVAARVAEAHRKPESHRKGAKDAKGDSHASNSKRVIDSKSVPRTPDALNSCRWVLLPPASRIKPPA
jgi:hypothetical protein